MENYSQFTFDHFYLKHSWEGGLTAKQVEALYVHSMKRKHDEYKFIAAVHGHDISGDNNKNGNQQQQQPATQSLPIFRDPEEYTHMSKEKQDELTQKMKQQHEVWANQALKGKKNG